MSKLWPKYENWSKLENRIGLYRYMSNMYRYKLAKNDQKRNCTGTSSKCTGTSLRKVPRMCVFHPFLHILIPNQLYTSNTHQNHFKFPLESLFYSIHLSMDIFLPNSFMNNFQGSFQHGSQPIHKSNMMII